VLEGRGILGEPPKKGNAKTPEMPMTTSSIRRSKAGNARRGVRADARSAGE
jgi:hypothetical protein